MSDLYSSLLRQFNLDLEEKDQQINDLDQKIKESTEKSNDSRAKLRKIKGQKKQLKKEAKEFRFYHLKKFFDFLCPILMICFTLIILGAINMVFSAMIAARLASIEIGRNVPFNTPIANTIFKAICAGIDISIVYGLGKRIKSSIKETKERTKKHKKHSSLDEITKLITSKEFEIQALSEDINRQDQENTNLKLQKAIAELERGTIEQKIATIKEALVNALQNVNNSKIEQELNQTFNATPSLSASLAQIDEDEQTAKEGILARVLEQKN